jgi:hypothetical protein
MGVGSKINNLFLELGIYQGLTDLFEYPNSKYSGSARNGLFKLTVGYYL